MMVRVCVAMFRVVLAALAYSALALIGIGAILFFLVLKLFDGSGQTDATE